MEGSAAIWVAVIGFFGVVVTTAGVVINALFTGRRQRIDAATEAANETKNEMEEVLRERLTLRDETIAALRARLDAALAERDACMERERRRSPDGDS